MKAVYSFTSTPFSTEQGTRSHGGFYDLEMFYCSWVLTTQLARQHFAQVEIITDSAGAAILEPLRLPVDRTLVALDELPYHRELWALGKLHAYRMQTTPFLHIDYDAYLWEPLSARFRRAELICQSIETSDYYDLVIDMFERLSGFQPDFVRENFAQHARSVYALCMGVFGGNNIEAIHEYCDKALETVTHPANEPMWTRLYAQHAEAHGILNDCNLLIEQYFAGCYARTKKIPVELILNGRDDVPFTHLMSESKREQQYADMLKYRVSHQFPAEYRLIQDLLGA